MAAPEPPPGVMDASYAEGRIRAAHLRWRYQVRAAFAVGAFRERAGAVGRPRVLDLGAAEGLTLLAMRERLGPGRYDGVELSDELLGAAPSLPDDVHLWRGDVAALPAEVAAGTYDLCTALAVLEHLPDPLACLKEAHRALRPGGVVVASCPHPVWDEVAGRLGLVADEHHESHMNARRMASLAEQAGFVDVVCRPFMWAPVGVLPYARVWIDPERALAVDARVRRLPGTSLTFVNQGLVAVKPE
ncbi:MAG: class I SAM-dependent methyltransferase [Myxococcota bacterium]